MEDKKRNGRFVVVEGKSKKKKYTMAKQKRVIEGFDPLEEKETPKSIDELRVVIGEEEKPEKSEEEIAEEELARDEGVLMVDPQVIVEAGELPVLLKREPRNDIKEEAKITIDGERWFTYQQLAKVLMCTHASVFNYVKKGKVEVKKINGVKLYRLNGYM